MISIIIPAYNDANSVSKTIESVLDSKDVEIEIIIVNDGSTDNTRHILAKYEFNSKVRVIHQENKGSNPARNVGYNESNGDFLLFLDADAELNTLTLSKLWFALTNSNASFAYTDFIFGFKKFKTGKFDLEKLKKLNYIHTSSLIKREDFPMFDENIKRFQDWDLWLTMSANGKTGIYVPGEVIKFSTIGIGISSWLPKSWYKAPWTWLPWIKPRVKKYQDAKIRIIKKHGL